MVEAPVHHQEENFGVRSFFRNHINTVCSQTTLEDGNVCELGLFARVSGWLTRSHVDVMTVEQGWGQ